MNKRIKICGLSSLQQINTAATHGAFWYGLVFYSKSPRYIPIKKARELIKGSPKDIVPVSITVDAKLSEIKKISELGIKTFQLHGDENLNYCKEIKKLFSATIIKSIGVREEKDLFHANYYINDVDWIIFDYKSNEMQGGSGKSFNWQFLKDKKLNFKWILSGGLDYNNVAEAINTTQAKALDVSSGVENFEGEKSIELIKKFCDNVRNVNEKKK